MNGLINYFFNYEKFADLILYWITSLQPDWSLYSTVLPDYPTSCMCVNTWSSVRVCVVSLFQSVLFSIIWFCCLQATYKTHIECCTLEDWRSIKALVNGVCKQQASFLNCDRWIISSQTHSKWLWCIDRDRSVCFHTVMFTCFLIRAVCDS